MFGLATRGKAKAREWVHTETAWLAWHIEYLQRVKRMPKLTELIGKPPAPSKPKSGDQLLAIAMLWDKALNAAPARPPASRP